MEKETVLEIEFMPVWDKWAWKITKQNEDILKRGTFRDYNIGVTSTCFPDFCNSENFLCIRGACDYKDDEINICSSEEKTLIEEKVKAINEKYGIVKRWRAGNEESYYLIHTDFSVERDKEYYTVTDNKRYEFGNYLKSREEALEYAEYMKQKSLEWHEKRDNNE